MSEKTANKISNVPNLRFKDDDENWKKNLLSELATFIGGGTPSTKNKYYWNGNIGWISSSDLLDNDIYNINITRFINEEAIANSATKLCPPNTIHIVSRVGVGKIAISKKALCTSQDFVNVINYKLSPLFMTYQLQKKIKDLTNSTQGTSIKGITTKEIGLIELTYPNDYIQNKISKFFNLIDKRMQTQSKIIKDLEEQKKEISNILFLQPPIKKDALSDIYKKGKAGGTPKSTNKLYYGGEIPFLSISDMTEQGKYIYKTKKYLTEMGVKNSSTWIVPTNSLILSMYASVGQVAINKIPIATSQAMFSMIVSENNVLNYLYYYLSYFKEKKLHRFLETGTQSNINADFVKTIEIPNYGKARNDLITSILSLFDEKIQIEKDILVLYKKQKAYLLQNMFI